MRFRFADCVLDAERFELSRAGAPIAIQPKVLELLLYLVRNAERTPAKAELLDAIWPGVATSESSLTRAVSFARGALGEREADARILVTVRGRGYRIGVPVAVEPAAHAPGGGDFVGRVVELAEAERALAAAARGHGQLLLLAGEAGIGKTRLAREIEARAGACGFDVRWGRCQEGESGRAYLPFEQILRAEVASWSADALQETLDEAALAELAELAPELRLRLSELPPAESDPARARARLFDAVTRLLAAHAAKTPLLLVLDDAHCADEPSLGLLRSLARDLASLRMLLLATYREAEVGSAHPFAFTGAELARLHAERRTLLLRGLAAEEAERLVRRRLGADAADASVRSVVARGEGNPLFLRELASWLGDAAASPADATRVPAGIRPVLRGRLAGLPAPCRAVLEAAAVLGREFSAAQLAALCGGDGAATLAALEIAGAAGLVEALPGRPGRFAFTHGLVAETLAEDLGVARRAELHLRAGEVLEALYQPQPLVPTREPLPIRGVYLAELAHHFTAALPAGDPAKALGYAERAGEHALSRLAFEEAEALFERALRVLDAARPADDALRARLAAGRARAAAGRVAG